MSALDGLLFVLCNCLDTSIWFRDNEEIYRKYLEDEISDIEENMGFEF